MSSSFSVLQLLENKHRFWLVFGMIAIMAAVISLIFVQRRTLEEKEKMLFAMHGRAESLAWTIEGAARFFASGRHGPAPDMLMEMVRQPGIAWVALLDENGAIVLDSYPQLIGSLLYTPKELRSLNPGEDIQGRFSPDDPDIYETWMLFHPARICMGKARKDIYAKYIFIALDATYFNKALQDYATDLALICALFSLALLISLALLFYIHNYRASRRKLLDTQALAEQIIKSYPAALLVAGQKGQINLLNARARDMLLPARSQAPRTLAEIPRLDWEGLLNDLREGIPVLEREQTLIHNGREMPVSVSAISLINEEKQPTGVLFILRDLGEVDLLKKKLAQSRRLSTLGKLASGLAHEIRNPLSSIRGYAHYLGQKLANDPMGLGAANLLEEETQRLDRVLADLLAFARPQELKKEKTSLQSLLQRAQMLVQPDLDNKKLNFCLNTPKEEILVMADADKLLQAVLNLLLNAVQATPEKGTITLSLENEQSSPMPGWRIKIADTGKGMSQQVMTQIFTPYFTTKPNGTGLGLPLSQQIVEGHGGALAVQSLPGMGATFTIILPDEAGNGKKTDDPACGR